MNNINGLEIKCDNDKVHICELSIIDKSHRQSFQYMHKYANDVLDVILFNLYYSNIATFSGTK